MDCLTRINLSKGLRAFEVKDHFIYINLSLINLQVFKATARPTYFREESSFTFLRMNRSYI